MRWEEVKKLGSEHYKGSSIEPIDLMKAGGILRDKAVGDIIKYAFRNRREVKRNASISDLKKIVHYAEMLISIEEERLLSLARLVTGKERRVKCKVQEMSL